ncbi:hypothetical protein [Bifidobacterium sp. ESL0764]|uniref:hypothetical protein n=1 Tax=Bifidobacterium sp. ESL0764 TaxID=2983228 RepID=UPI0023F9827C|nr:hypothetical protein [Bifidobacterium sp. ESL0764]WEV65558.1 hypothetical protein OZX71_07360 [Bifidobacterium sp. ESL0764]
MTADFEQSLFQLGDPDAGLPFVAAFVTRDAGGLVGLSVEDLRNFRGDPPFDVGLELGLVDLYDSVRGYGPRLLFNQRLFDLVIENRTQAVPHLYQIPKPKVRKLPDATGFQAFFLCP